MLITDKLIYLEMEKTASSHINHLLSECFPAKRIGKHNTLDSLNKVSNLTQDDIVDKFIFGSVRNPWDWYVSLWAQGCHNSSTRFRGGLYESLTTKKPFSRSFFLDEVGEYRPSLSSLVHMWREVKKPAVTWLNLYSDCNSPDLFRLWLKLLYKEENVCHLTRLWATYPKSSIRQFAGLMTYRYCVFFTKGFLSKEAANFIQDLSSLKEFEKQNTILNGVVRVEYLEQDLLTAISQAGYKIDRKIESVINTNNKIFDKVKKINASNHNHTAHYYDEETIQIIAEKEKLIIEKYSYEPPIINSTLDKQKKYNSI